jgi:histidyl-tRNA synthetase
VAQKLRPPKGTRDFYPEALRLRTWLFEHFRAVSRSFGFEEVDAPVVEHAQLFTRKAGEEILEQLYHFEMHDRHLALRPEMTPSIARMVMNRAGSLRLPLRWFAITQNWRYERMMKGRKREHYQWNLDIWGEPSVSAEAELIAALLTLLDRLGLGRDDVKVRVNSRALLEETLSQTVLKKRREVFPALCVAIDKLDKIGGDAVVELLTDPEGAIRLKPGEAKEVVARLGLRDFEAAAASAPAGSTAVKELRRLFELLDHYGVRDRVEFDASIVRGLSYYTGIVFEAFDAQGKLRALCGGGRYDRLLETLGAKKPLPAAGLGFGDVVILELLADRGLLPELSRDLDAVVFAFGEDERPQAVRLATALRAEGLAVELAPVGGKLGDALEAANAAGARLAYVVGPDEVRRGAAFVRDLDTGEQSTHPLPE